MLGHYSKTKLNAKIIEKYNNKNKFKKQHNSGRHTISCPLTLNSGRQTKMLILMP